MDIKFCINKDITPEQFIGLLQETSLGERRPLHDPVCIAGMLKNANLLITAWVDDKLVGVARSVTDFHYCCYLSDLAVSERYQSRGIGKELIRHTFACLESGCTLILLAAPQAVDYYPRIGFEKHNSAWVMRDKSELK